MAETMTRIWLIDDALNKTTARPLVPEEAELTVTEPGCPSEPSAAFAAALTEEWDLILVDEQLWESEAPPAPPHAVDGLSVVWTLRSWGRLKRRRWPPIVILTSREQAFADETPDIGAWLPLSQSFIRSEASLSRALGVEWILSKNDDNVASNVKALADGFKRALEICGSDGASLDELKEFLEIDPSCEWAEGAERALRASEPPVTQGEDSRDAHRGPVVVITWLLWNALPFPGLFISDLHAAAFLGLKPEALNEALTKGGQYAARMKQAVYSGPLANLFKRRWWAPALAAIASEFHDLETLLSELDLKRDDALPSPDSVVVLDSELHESGIEPIANTVRINPRDWPGREQPFVRIETAKAHRWLEAIVDDADRAELAS